MSRIDPRAFKGKAGLKDPVPVFKGRLCKGTPDHDCGYPLEKYERMCKWCKHEMNPPKPPKPKPRKPRPKKRGRPRKRGRPPKKKKRKPARRCRTCQTNIDNLPHQAIRCKPCAARRRKMLRHRRYRKKHPWKRKSRRRPWKKLGRPKKRVYLKDSPDYPERVRRLRRARQKAWKARRAREKKVKLVEAAFERGYNIRYCTLCAEPLPEGVMLQHPECRPEPPIDLKRLAPSLYEQRKEWDREEQGE